MPEILENMSIRPAQQEQWQDIVSDVLDAVHLQTRIFGRIDLGAPWAIRVPPGGDLFFYVMARGGAWLELEGAGTEGSAPIALSAGDVVLLRHRGGHVLRDEGRTAREVHTVGGGDCPRPTTPGAVRLGGDGPVTTLVTGAFTFVARPNVLLESLPAVLHAPAGDPRTTAQLTTAAQLILAESAAPGPGSSMLSARLAEILLINALRARVRARETGDEHCPGLCALADPAIGAARGAD